MNLEELRALGLIETRACRHGTLSFLRTDQYIAQSLGYYGEFSESEINVWRTLLRSDDNVVSAGCNIGAHVVWFGKHCHAGKVLSVEPQEALYEIACENIRQNGLDNVELRHAALGDHAGRAHLPRLDYRYPFSFGSVGTGSAGQYGDSALVVELVTIDELLGGRSVRLIHLDVEGHELAALKGAQKAIHAHRPYLYLECDRSGLKEDLLQALALLGYEALLHEAPLYNPQNFDGNRMNVFGGTVSISLLGIPKGGA